MWTLFKIQQLQGFQKECFFLKKSSAIRLPCGPSCRAPWATEAALERLAPPLTQATPATTQARQAPASQVQRILLTGVYL